MSGELIGHAIARLWEAGALDVYTTAIQMKKNRPGVTLSVLCGADQVPAIEAILFRETTTLGVRRWQVERRKLRRETRQVETPWGKVDGDGGLARCQDCPLLAGVRVVPPRGRGPRRAAQDGLRRGAECIPAVACYGMRRQ